MGGVDHKKRFYKYVEALQGKEVREVDGKLHSQCVCPAHMDKQASLTVTYNPASKQKVLFYCHAGCSYSDIHSKLGRATKNTVKRKRKKTTLEFVTTYVYRTHDNTPKYSVTRYKELDKEGKVVGKPHIPSALDGTSTIPTEEKVLYNLPLFKEALEKDKTVLYVEGEKDADTALYKLKCVATTHMGGANSFKKQYLEQVRGLNLAIIPDNDAPGLHSAERLANLYYDYAKSIKLLQPLGTKKGYDLTDWVEEGHTKEELAKIIKRTPFFDPDEGDINIMLDSRKELEVILKNDPDKPYKNCDKDNSFHFSSLPFEESPGDYPFTDVGNSERLANSYKQCLRFVPELDSWALYIKEKGLWATMGHLFGHQAITELAWRMYNHYSTMPIDSSNDEEAKTIAMLKSNALKLQSNSKQKSVLNQASTMNVFHETVTSFDKEAYLINAPNGVIDLKTGKISPHSSDPKFMRTLSIPYAPSYEEPRLWTQFLERCFKQEDANKTEELVKFAQKIAGYTLIGNSYLQIFCLLYGLGGSGKSTFLNVLRAIHGDVGEFGYSAVSQTDTFCENKYSGGGVNATPELAKLVGARLVTGGELQKNARLSDNILKAISGSGSITARALRSNPVTYKVQFLLFLEANKSVYVDPSDTGMVRRLTILPFDNPITTQQEIIGDYDEVLIREEGTNILSWMVEGAILLQKEGLNPPTFITDTKHEYFQDYDVFQRFLEDLCHIGGEYQEDITSHRLYGIYKKWCEIQGERASKQLTFSKELKDKGITREVRRMDGEVKRVYIGIRLKQGWEKLLKEGYSDYENILKELEES